MKNYIPYDKLSKKEQSKLDQIKCRDWNKVNPVTRIIYSERAIQNQFMKSMRRDNKLRKRLNAPIAKYDALSKKAYLEYPDGRIVYIA